MRIYLAAAMLTIAVALNAVTMDAPVMPAKVEAPKVEAPLPQKAPDRIDDNTEFYKQDKIPFADRVPTSKDKGLFWVYESGGTTALYIRNRVSGTWTLIGP